MHSSSSNIKNKSMQERRCFTHRRCSPPQLSSVWQLGQRQDCGHFLRLTFPLPEPKTTEDNDRQLPKSETVHISPWVRCTPPDFHLGCWTWFHTAVSGIGMAAFDCFAWLNLAQLGSAWLSLAPFSSGWLPLAWVGSLQLRLGSVGLRLTFTSWFRVVLPTAVPLFCTSVRVGDGIAGWGWSPQGRSWPPVCWREGGSSLSPETKPPGDDVSGIKQQCTHANTVLSSAPLSADKTVSCIEGSCYEMRQSLVNFKVDHFLKVNASVNSVVQKEL